MKNINKRLLYSIFGLSIFIDLTCIASIILTFQSASKNIKKEVLNTFRYHTDDRLTNEFIDNVIDNDLFSYDMKKNVLKLSEYVEENEYLSENFIDNYSTLYVNRNIVDEYPATNDGIHYKRGQYHRDMNYISLYLKENEENSLTLMHELVHVSGHSDITFLNEGLVSIITAEYFNDGICHSYVMQSNFVKILFELLGRETVLSAFSSDDVSIIYNGLVNIGFEYGNALKYIDSIQYFCDNFELDKDVTDSITFITTETFEATERLEKSNYPSCISDNIYVYLYNFYGNNHIKDYVNIDQWYINEDNKYVKVKKHAN